MKKTSYRNLAMCLTGAAVFAGSAALLPVSVAQAQSTPTYEEAKVQKGLSIAPVPLNMGNRDPKQVGYGSYLVNATGGCNDCHTNPSYQPDGDPFRGMPKKVNAAGYLAGGVVFGPFTSRNITPNKDGRSLENFKKVMRTGEDLRKLHPQISPLLQVMPWPVYQDLLDSDLEAIFAYLNSIPCVEGGPEEKPNRCGATAATTAVAEPKNFSTYQIQINLDGKKSMAADGKALQYRWTQAPQSPIAAIAFADTDTPTVQFSSRGPAAYKFLLTVTDSTGHTATDTVTINYEGR